MRIHFVCHELPIPSYAGTLQVLHSLRYFSEKYHHSMTLIAFKLEGKAYPDLGRYCQIETIDLPYWPSLQSPRTILKAFKNMYRRGRFSFGDFAFSREMDSKINSSLGNNNYDVVVIDHPIMLNYILNKKVPTVLLEAFELSEIAYMEYRDEKNWIFKIIRLLYYFQIRGYARKYNAVSEIIAVSSQQKKTVISHCPNLNITVIPIGIDTDFFKTVEPETAFPSLIINGSMDKPANIRMVLGFYHDVYPLIKSEVSQIKLFIVGSRPDKEILKLSADKSVVITGYVEDLRPYLSRAW
jgi:glycosyltransferase involved in cell wall biosynthesis